MKSGEVRLLSSFTTIHLDSVCGLASFKEAVATKIRRKRWRERMQNDAYGKFQADKIRISDDKTVRKTAHKHRFFDDWGSRGQGLVFFCQRFKQWPQYWEDIQFLNIQCKTTFFSAESNRGLKRSMREQYCRQWRSNLIRAILTYDVIL